jgi:uncharacterized phage infection (PIP) family protein YhgE
MIGSLRNLRASFNDIIANVHNNVEKLIETSDILDNLSDKANTEILNARSAVEHVEQHSEEAMNAVETTATAIEEVTKAASKTAAATPVRSAASTPCARSSATPDLNFKEDTIMFNRPTKETALSAYVAALAEMRETLALLLEHADDHLGTSPDDINWGHVGSAGYVNEQLRNITGFLGLTEQD